MPPSRSLLFFVVAAVTAVAAVAPGRASADEAPKPTASGTCERSIGPGRVRCEAEVIVPAGVVVRWADVQVVETPAFVTALKGRIGPADATLRESDKWRFSFGLVAKARGTGDVRLRVRAVVCREETCTAELLPFSVGIVSGS